MKRPSTRFSLGIVAGVAAALMLLPATAQTPAPVSPEWTATLAAAKKEGRVVLYIGYPGLDQTISQAWNKAYPDIKLEIIRGSSGDLIAKLDQEKAAGADGGDVAVHSSGGWFEKTPANFTAPNGPAAKAWDLKGKTYAVPFITPLGIYYNPVETKRLGIGDIDEWKDLADPRLGAGRLAAESITASSAGVQYWWHIYTYADPSVLEGMAASKPTIFKSTPPIAQAVAAGEHAVGAWATDQAAADLVAQKAPIKTVHPNPQFQLQYTAGIASWSKRPAAAQVFMNWLLDEKGGQTAINSIGLTASPQFKIPGMLEVGGDAKFYNGTLTPEQTNFRDNVYPKFGMER